MAGPPDGASRHRRLARAIGPARPVATGIGISDAARQFVTVADDGVLNAFRRPRREAHLTRADPIVILGAGGFIGRALTARLAQRGAKLRAVMRNASETVSDVEIRVAGKLGPGSEWSALFDGARAIVHLATRAHAPPGDESWIEDEVKTASVLAQAARTAGVERVLFLSSVKAMGAASRDEPFRADGLATPADAYGRAKLRIEAALQTAPGLVVLRPPLVYGPGVKGNFRALLRLIARGTPLPLASVDNCRSVIFIENLIDLIEIALVHNAAPGGVYLMRDDEEISTPDLCRRLGRHLDHTARLFSCPPALLRQILRLAGRGDQATALLGSLTVDDGQTHVRLGWTPRRSLDDGLAATCHWFQNQRP